MSNTQTLADKVRTSLSIIVIALSFGTLITIAILFIKSSAKDSETQVFNTLVPLAATWIGTILAFYFGKENFEAATSKYKEIVDKLSPEVLEQVNVGQVMILRKTMIIKDMNKIGEQTMEGIAKYLKEIVDKSRLPILEGDKIKNVLHRKIALLANPEQKLSDYLKTKEAAQPFIKVKASDTIGKVLKDMDQKPGCRDAFILDANEQVLGWVTDSLLSRYLTVKHE